MTPTIDELLAEARRHLRRVTPDEAAALQDGGALLVDIRPAHQRAEHGTIPGAVLIDRNVLEWRLDPRGDHRIAELRSADQPVVVFCQEGYASSLAAATLQQLGLTQATDLEGGFGAWAAEGRAVDPAGDRS